MEAENRPSQESVEYRHAEAGDAVRDAQAAAPAQQASASAEPADESAQPDENAEPYVRDGRKMGRNEPCWCGSGRKYKHCHGKLQ